jgi:hypothetical protein
MGNAARNVGLRQQIIAVAVNDHCQPPAPHAVDGRVVQTRRNGARTIN